MPIYVGVNDVAKLVPSNWDPRIGWQPLNTSLYYEANDPGDPIATINGGESYYWNGYVNQSQLAGKEIVKVGPGSSFFADVYLQGHPQSGVQFISMHISFAYLGGNTSFKIQDYRSNSGLTTDPIIDFGTLQLKVNPYNWGFTLSRSVFNTTASFNIGSWAVYCRSAS